MQFVPKLKTADSIHRVYYYKGMCSEVCFNSSGLCLSMENEVSWLISEISVGQGEEMCGSPGDWEWMVSPQDLIGM